MHYRHLFHAGNFADVFKHVLLLGLLEALRRKDKPYLFLDTHAGEGLYNLRSNEAERTAEWKDGLGLIKAQSAPTAWVKGYLELIQSLEGTAKHVRLYPGSPKIAASQMRVGDRIICCEQNREIAEQLRNNLPELTLHVRSGYEAHAFLPPQEKRGLVLIDPPFEARDEFPQCEDFLEKALGRWSNGIYAVWYPLKQQHDAQRFVRRVRRLAKGDVLNCSLDTGARSQGQMHACGMLIINPPFGFAEQARLELSWLVRALAQGTHPACNVDEIDKEAN